jgi:hypothetical protein
LTGFLPANTPITAVVITRISTGGGPEERSATTTCGNSSTRGIVCHRRAATVNWPPLDGRTAITITGNDIIRIIMWRIVIRWTPSVTGTPESGIIVVAPWIGPIPTCATPVPLIVIAIAISERNIKARAGIRAIPIGIPIRVPR